MGSRSVEEQVEFERLVAEFKRKDVITRVPQGVRGLPVDLWEDVPSGLESLTARPKERIMESDDDN